MRKDSSPEIGPVGSGATVDVDLFKAIGDEQTQLTQQADFIAQYGIDKTQYLQAYDSMHIHDEVDHAARLILDEGINDVPTLVVNGQYETGSGYINGLQGKMPAHASSTLLFTCRAQASSTGSNCAQCGESYRKNAVTLTVRRSAPVRPVVSAIARSPC
ncbi:hypothetical protein [Burkholderia ambifaria]|uniref:hypothetical protein n=1 Tax=Burkholderia ambifaria TaxID=152480 RepID=UPI000680114A|nr:hypothetical protein [Burkholderia ambifaria]